MKVEDEKEEEKKADGQGQDGQDQNGHPPMDTFEDFVEYELFLQSYAWIGRCEFLTKRQILKQYGREGVRISFDYRHIERFRVSLERLVLSEESKIVLCVTHREGIREIDGRLHNTHVPYCAMAKYG